MLIFDDLLLKFNDELQENQDFVKQSKLLRDSLHNNSVDDPMELFSELRSWYTENIKPLEARISEQHGEMAQYLIAYMKQVKMIIY